MAAVFSDEDLARELQAMERERPADATPSNDEVIARLMQAQENGSRHAADRRPQQQQPLPSPPVDCAICLPLFVAVMSSGAVLGCATGLQFAGIIGLGNCGSCLAAICGACAGHTATQPPQRRRHPRPAQEEGEEWEQPASDDDADAGHRQRGLAADVIEGHTVGHIYAGPVGGAPGASESQAREGGSSEPDQGHKCMVCMDSYEAGDALRTLPCLHSYHQRCIDEWFSRSAECPICKRDITDVVLLPPSPVARPPQTMGLGDRLGRLFRRRS